MITLSTTGIVMKSCEVNLYCRFTILVSLLLLNMIVITTIILLFFFNNLLLQKHDELNDEVLPQVLTDVITINDRIN